MSSSPRSSVRHTSPTTRCKLAGFGVPALLPATVLASDLVPRRTRPGAARRLRRPLDPAPEPAGQRRRRPPLPDHRARRDLADRTGRVSGDHRRARRIPPRRSAAASRPGPGLLRSPTSLHHASSSSTRAPTRSRPSGRRYCPAGTCTNSAGIATGRASSRSTGRSTARSRGPIRPASTRRPCTSAGRSTRSRPRRRPSGTAASRRPAIHDRRAVEPLRQHRARRPASTPAGRTAMCPPDPLSTSPTCSSARSSASRPGSATASWRAT